MTTLTDRIAEVLNYELLQGCTSIHDPRWPIRTAKRIVAEVLDRYETEMEAAYQAWITEHGTRPGHEQLSGTLSHTCMCGATFPLSRQSWLPTWAAVEESL